MLDQIKPGGVRRGLGSVYHVGLIQYISHVRARCRHTDGQLLADLPVGLASGNEAQHLDLPLGQAVGIGRGRRRPGLNPLQPLGYSLHQGPHAQLAGDGQGLVQQGYGLGTIPLSIALS